MHLSLPKIGALIQEYGRFIVHETWVQKGERKLPSAMYRISLKQPDGSLLPLTSIPVRHSDREHVIERIRSWLQSQAHQIAQTKQWMSETQDTYIIEKYQAQLDKREPQYKMVLQALQEIDPSAHIEEPRALYQRNVSYSFDHNNVFPTVEPGTISRDFGLFRIYEVHESRNGEELPLSHDVCFIPSNGDVMRLGNLRLPDMSFSSLMSFLHSWLASRERALQKAKERLLTTTDPEGVARLQRIISWNEDSFFPVLHAVEKLEADPDLNRGEKLEEE
jgi:hypothetical protein